MIAVGPGASQMHFKAKARKHRELAEALMVTGKAGVPGSRWDESSKNVRQRVGRARPGWLGPRSLGWHPSGRGCRSGDFAYASRDEVGRGLQACIHPLSAAPACCCLSCCAAHSSHLEPG